MCGRVGSREVGVGVGVWVWVWVWVGLGGVGWGGVRYTQHVTDVLPPSLPPH